MNFNLSLKILVSLSFLLFSSCSDKDPIEKDEISNELETEKDKITNEPELTENYYFEGKLDGEAFLIEKKYYKDYSDQKPFILDYGGTLINCSNEPENNIYTDCYTFYSSGIHVNRHAYPEELGKHNTAKMYFGAINVDKRIFDNELTALKKFLKNDKLTFRRDFGINKKRGTFAFDFFPPSTHNFNQIAFSSRYNDNSEYTANITSVEEIDDYFYIIEGTVETCKLYDLREYKNTNPAYKVLTDFKFRVKIKADFNYNNYKDE